MQLMANDKQDPALSLAADSSGLGASGSQPVAAVRSKEVFAEFQSEGRPPDSWDSNATATAAAPVAVLELPSVATMQG